MADTTAAPQKRKGDDAKQEPEPKKKRKIVRLTKELLLDEKGFRRLKSNSRHLFQENQSEVFRLDLILEADFLQSMLLHVQKWAHDLCPIHFEDFISQGEKICGGAVIRVI